jgi:hypothetical protein
MPAMKAQDLARLVKIYERWAQSVCAPILFPDEEGRMHNGTMTFLRTEVAVLGITNSTLHLFFIIAGDGLR